MLFAHPDSNTPSRFSATRPRLPRRAARVNQLRFAVVVRILDATIEVYHEAKSGLLQTSNAVLGSRFVPFVDDDPRHSVRPCRANSSSFTSATEFAAKRLAVSSSRAPTCGAAWSVRVVRPTRRCG